MSTVQTQQIPTGTWKADPVHSSVAFEVEHLGVSTFRGAFKQFDATVEASEDGISIAGTGPVESLTVEAEDLRAHLLSPEFFDAERHPEVGFRSTGVRAEDGGLVIEGELILRGVSKQVAVRGEVGEPGVDPGGNERVALRFDTQVDRTEFGLDWNMDLPNGNKALADEVRLVAELELVRS